MMQAIGHERPRFALLNADRARLEGALGNTARARELYDLAITTLGSAWGEADPRTVALEKERDALK